MPVRWCPDTRRRLLIVRCRPCSVFTLDPDAHPHIRQHRPAVLRDRGRHLGARIGLVGRDRRPRPPDRPGARARRHLLRQRRCLRAGAQRGDRRPRARGRGPGLDPDLDQVRLRARFRAAAALRGRAAPELVGRPRPQGARGEFAPPRNRLRRPLPAAQPADGRDRARRAVRRARGAGRRGQDPPLRRRARAARSGGATRA